MAKLALKNCSRPTFHTTTTREQHQNDSKTPKQQIVQEEGKTDILQNIAPLTVCFVVHIRRRREWEESEGDARNLPPLRQSHSFSLFLLLKEEFSCVRRGVIIPAKCD